MDTSFRHAPPHCFSNPNDESIPKPCFESHRKFIICFWKCLPMVDKSIMVISSARDNWVLHMSSPHIQSHKKKPSIICNSKKVCFWTIWNHNQFQRPRLPSLGTRKWSDSTKNLKGNGFLVRRTLICNSSLLPPCLKHLASLIVQ